MAGSSSAHRKGLKVRAFISALLLGALLTILLIANGWKHELHVKSIQVEGNILLKEAEVRTLAAIPVDGNLFDIDLYAVRQRLQQNHFVRDADVSRHLPYGITITIIERTPIAALVLDRLLYIDEEGYVLPSLRPERILDLPVLTGNIPRAACVPGRRISDGPVREALNILTMAKRGGNELEQLISEIHIEADSSLEIFTTESGIAVEFGRGDDAMKLAMLNGFWKQCVLQRGAAELATVDLRFADQVVVRWNRVDDGSKQ